jgi:membrane-associated protein
MQLADVHVPLGFIRELIDLVLHFDRHLDAIVGNYGTWTYGLLFLIIFCETGLVVTPFLPGDSLLFAAGAVAARGLLSIPTLCVLLMIAAIAGDAVNYWIGRAAASGVLHSRYKRFVRQEHLDKTHAFYERHGAKTIVLARFVPIIRTFAPFVAGFGAMAYSRFTMYNVAGGVLWILLFVVGGYLFGNLPFVREHFSLVVAGVIVASFLPMVVAIWQERRRGGARPGR